MLQQTFPVRKWSSRVLKNLGDEKALGTGFKMIVATLFTVWARQLQFPPDTMTPPRPQRNEKMTNLQLFAANQIAHNFSDETYQLMDDLLSHFDGELDGRSIAVWGQVEGSRELSAETMFFVDWLVNQGANVRLHAPAEVDWPQTQVECFASSWDALLKAEAVVVMTDNVRYSAFDAGRFRWYAGSAAIFDLSGSVAPFDPICQITVSKPSSHTTVSGGIDGSSAANVCQYRRIAV